MDAPFTRALKPGYASPSYGGSIGFVVGERGSEARSSNYVHSCQHSVHELSYRIADTGIKGRCRNLGYAEYCRAECEYEDRMHGESL